jgi:hypothetical protein
VRGLGSSILSNAGRHEAATGACRTTVRTKAALVADCGSLTDIAYLEGQPLDPMRRQRAYANGSENDGSREGLAGPWPPREGVAPKTAPSGGHAS